MASTLIVGKYHLLLKALVKLRKAHNHALGERAVDEAENDWGQRGECNVEHGDGPPLEMVTPEKKANHRQGAGGHTFPHKDQVMGVLKFLDWLYTASSSPEAQEVAAKAFLYFVKLHPYPDANGRTGRLLLSLILMRKALKPLQLTEVTQRIIQKWASIINLMIENCKVFDTSQSDKPKSAISPQGRNSAILDPNERLKLSARIQSFPGKQSTLLIYLNSFAPTVHPKS
uniref:Fido domain-containing protein n=1 Tax=Globodera rostochiensis TaxID=31243 RepID=A0A914H474_GLORO